MKSLLHAGALALACLLLSDVAAAQNGPPRYTPLADGTRKETTPAATYCSTDNGTTWVPCSGSGGGGSATDPRVAQGSPTAGQTGTLTQGAVVTGDQAWTSGETRPYTLTPTGRLKVGLSSAGNVEPSNQLATTLTADLVGCKYRNPVTWSIGWTGSLGCDANGNLNVNNVTLPPGAATAANQATMIANAPALAIAGSSAPASGTQAMGTDGTTARALRTDTAGNQTVIGSIASGVADTGNPIKVGGYASNIVPTAVANGQRVNAWYGLNGQQYSTLVSGVGGARIGTQDGSTDTVSTANLGLVTASLGYVFNGTSWDRARGDTAGTYIVSKGGGSLATGQVSVGTTSTLLAAARAGRQKITVSVGSATACAFGNTGVTTTTGFPLQPTAGASITLDTAAALYAVCSATATVSFLEQF